MLLQIIYQDKATQTEIVEEDTLEKILNTLTTLSMKVDSMGIEIEKLKTNEGKLIGLATIIQELANNYANGNPIWSYYSRDHQMIYSNSKELRQADMEDVRQWILTLLNPEKQST